MSTQTFRAYYLKGALGTCGLRPLLYRDDGLWLLRAHLGGVYFSLRDPANLDGVVRVVVPEAAFLTITDDRSAEGVLADALASVAERLNVAVAALRGG